LNGVLFDDEPLDEELLDEEFDGGGEASGSLPACAFFSFLSLKKI
jgi:hypothetical protein